jgi:hypothetical protein
MKTNRTLRQIALLFTVLVSITACKKDKKDPEPTPPGELKAITITELKALSTSASVKIPDLRSVKGIVISDVSAKNIDSKTIILQEAVGKPGIVVTLNAANTFAAGDELELTVSNQTLAQVDGEVVLQNLPLANVKKTGTGTITPAETTISAIMAAKSTVDGTLVKIAATELSGGNGNYEGSLTIKDATGQLSTQILSGAAFAGDPYPASVSSITGIVRISGNVLRIDMRKPSDVVIGNITRVVTETFSGADFYLTDEQRENLDLSKHYPLMGYFSTPVGLAWQPRRNLFVYDIKAPGQEGDKLFLTDATKKYIYLSKDNYIGTMGETVTNTKGLKSVTITFAGSKRTTAYYDYAEFDFVNGEFKYVLKNENIDLGAFQEGQDYLQLSVTPAGQIGGAPLIAQDFNFVQSTDFKFNNTGQFYEVTYTVPTEAELKALNVDDGTIKEFLANPQISISNTSSRSLLIIDKVKFNY